MPSRRSRSHPAGQRRRGGPAVAIACLVMAVGVFTYVLGGPAPTSPTPGQAAEEVAPPPDDGEAIRWTRAPVAVDREVQGLPRVPARVEPDPFPTLLEVPKSVRVRDGATFVVDDEIYRIAGVVARGPHEICTDPAGRRFACGLRGRTGLWHLLAGRRMACRIEEPPGAATLLDCSLGNETLSARLLREGWVHPAPEAATDAPTEMAAE